VIALAVVAVGVVAVLVHGRHSRVAVAHAQTLTATANVAPQSFLFGTAVHVRVRAIVDRRAFDPDRVVLSAQWTPYAPVEPMRRQRTDVGRYSTLVWSVDVHCVVISCVPQQGSSERNVFPISEIRYRAPGKRRAVHELSIAWPEMIAWSRLDPVQPDRKAVVNKSSALIRRQNAAFGAPWHYDTRALPVTYRYSPTTVFATALALAAALVVAAGWLLWPYLPTTAWVRRRHDRRSPLERALAAVEEARGRPVDERKALELLAVELRNTGAGKLAWEATELAWSAETPREERTAALAGEIRREVAGRSNGHRA
jgi:hypothetical protein